MDNFNFDSRHDSIIIGSCPIKMDFDSRIESWINSILPNRLNAIRSNGGSPEYIDRMIKLLLSDKDRLYAKAYKEYKDNIEIFDLKVKVLNDIVNLETIAYYNEMR